MSHLLDPASGAQQACLTSGCVSPITGTYIQYKRRLLGIRTEFTSSLNMLRDPETERKTGK